MALARTSDLHNVYDSKILDLDRVAIPLLFNQLPVMGVSLPL